MKKSKIIVSLFSVVLCGIIMFSVFSSAFKKPAEVNVKIDGVKGRIYEFSENILNKINISEFSNENNSSRRMATRVCLGGYPIGLKLYADGVVVVDTESVDTKNGLVDTAKCAGIKIGDIIKYVDSKKVTSNKEVSSLIEQSNGREMVFCVLRGSEYLNLTFKAEFSESEQKYKAGIWIRDSSAGIGTVTFCTREGYFASLGHAVCDIDTKQAIPISQGDTTDVSIVNIVKGKSGAAGELCGYLDSEKTGDILYNGDLGVYGKFSSIPETEIYEIAFPDEIKTGEAKIYTTLDDGVIEEYDIQITGINENSQDKKNLIIKITDRDLIDKTGGIVQGMSGSPLLQNGKLVGAITHVLVEDPTRGYAIFAENMLETARSVEQSQDMKDAG